MKIRPDASASRLLLFAFHLFVAQFAVAQLVSVDASAPPVAAPPSPYHGGTSVNPRGETLGMNSRYLTRDGKPWLPVMGEFHFARVPEQQWEEQILKMKAAGVSIVSTYIFWIHHEEVEGQFDWSGSRDLRRFVELCGKHGMYVFPRIGPWSHGEARNGGFPDWLLKKTSQTRTTDPVYIAAVGAFYAQIATQLKGELWKDGGPVIGIQIENEYTRHGPGAGDDYIRQLKKMAVEDGLDVPFYTVTGWGGAAAPRGEVLPVFGGYPDAPWDSSLHMLPPQEVYNFRFGNRAKGDMGAIAPSKTNAAADAKYEYPFLTAEMGGGVQTTYRRRPVIQPDDVAAMVPVMLGSGVNLYGSYMFQGGENPEGRLTTLQESRATKYPTDLTVKSYDFQAPLGEFGDERPVLRKLKVFDYFMDDFGALLAPMQPHAPTVVPTGPKDLTVPRLAVRSNGDTGFLFLNNYLREAAMPVRNNFQVQVKLPGGTVAIPQKPITLPTGAYAIWPINLSLGSSQLRYATAQPFTQTTDATGTTFYFIETPGVAPEFVVKLSPGTRLVAPPGSTSTKGDTSVVRRIAPSLQDAFLLEAPGHPRIHIVLLTQHQAEDAWKVGSGPEQRLLLTSDQFYIDRDQVVLQSSAAPPFVFQVIPPSKALFAAGSNWNEAVVQGVDTYSSQGAVQHPTISFKQIAKAAAVPQSQPGLSRGQAPDDAAFNQSSRWTIEIPPNAWQGVDDLFLNVSYEGDVARLVSHGKLLTDNFYDGQIWHVGLKRFREQIAEGGIELQILPRRDDAPIYLEETVHSASEGGQTIVLRNLTLEPQYRFTLKLKQVPKG